MKKPTPAVIEIKEKIDPKIWIERLSTVLMAVDAMGDDERRAAFAFMRDKYSREWPSSSY
jgi:hypothetical protein